MFAIYNILNKSTALRSSIEKRLWLYPVISSISFCSPKLAQKIFHNKLRRGDPTPPAARTKTDTGLVACTKSPELRSVQEVMATKDHSNLKKTGPRIVSVTHPAHSDTFMF